MVAESKCNHQKQNLYATIAFRNTDKTINSIVANGKRFFLPAILLKTMSVERATELILRQTNC